MSPPKFKIPMACFFPRYPVDVEDEDDAQRNRKVQPCDSDDKEYISYYFGLLCSNPEYCESTIEKVSKSPKIEIGMSFDIISVLSTSSSDLVRRDESHDSAVCLRGKYILVCCFFVPILLDELNSLTAQSISSVCSELYSERDDFELVVVAKMRREYANDHSAFIDFLSGFPSSCLAVDPVSDSALSDYICKLLSLDTSRATYLLVDDAHHCQKVLQHSGNLDVVFFDRHGADTFPFTTLSSADAFYMSMEDMPPCKTPCQLEQLLGLNPSDFLLKNKHPGVEGTGSLDKVSVSLLKQSVVALHICVGVSVRNVCSRLNQVYKECRKEGHNFEAVLVYCPFWYPQGPRKFIKCMNSALRHHDMAWWILPYKDSVSRRLWGMCGKCMSDRVIIVGPSDESSYSCGGRVINSYNFGKVDASPLARMHLTKSVVRSIEDATLTSFLVYKERNYVLDLNNGNQRRVPVAGLRPKNVIVYFSMVPRISQSSSVYSLLAEWYSKMKQVVNPLYEVVFVGLNRFELDEVSSMPWLICPFNEDHSVAVFERLPSRSESIFLFGSDGRTVSIRAEVYLGLAKDYLESQDSGTDTRYCDIEVEIISALVKRYNMHDSLCRKRNIYEHGGEHTYTSKHALCS